MRSRMLSPVAVTLVTCALILNPSRGPAQSVILDKDEERVFAELSWLPYGFFSESFGLGVGAGGAYSGCPQEQASLLGAVTVGTKGSYNLMGGMYDYQLPAAPRLVINPFFALGRYQEQRLYVGYNPDFGGERAGENDSDPENFVEVTQWDNRAEIDFRFLLPIGHGKETIVSRYVVDQGILVSGASGGEAWSPFRSGRTTLAVTPGWREQTLEQEDLSVPLKTLNVEIALEHENYDFPMNPSRGSFKRISFKRDFDEHESLGEWETWTAEATRVFDLGESERSRQRSLVLGFWSAYVPTWETGIVDGELRVTKRTPQYEGATLGGIYRMRGYEDDRFHDKAAIYYAVELRTMPTWQPLKNIEWLSWAELKWWQWVYFAEAGQVASSYSLSSLHDDLHVDGGISIRVMAHNAVCRLDFSAGEEGGRAVAMYGHPF